jgi:hypothetical protein
VITSRCVNETTELLADAMRLADTGAFENSAEMRATLVLMSRDEPLVDWLVKKPDLRACLDKRCARARRRKAH